jgi:hypothetical protein
MEEENNETGYKKIKMDSFYVCVCVFFLFFFFFFKYKGQMKAVM